MQVERIYQHHWSSGRIRRYKLIQKMKTSFSLLIKSDAEGLTLARAPVHPNQPNSIHGVRWKSSRFRIVKEFLFLLKKELVISGRGGVVP